MKKGDVAPSFELENQFGKKINLSDFLKKQPIVLFFYPRDNTPGCTKEACTFRDFHSEFNALGCKIFGISSDSVERHAQFANDHKLTYDLLADTTGKVRKLYKVPTNLLGLIPGRVTYIIDAAGKIVDIHNSLTNPVDHISNALEIVKSL